MSAFTPDDLAGRQVLVVGLGVSGVATVSRLNALGASVVVADQRPDLVAGQAKSLGVAKVIPQDKIDVTGFELVVVSPGVRPNSLFKPGEHVIGELEFGSAFARSPIVAVTGTNGKTTVTHLTGEMLGKKAIVCGNIGRALSDVADVEDRVLVVEASSFQLYWSPRFSGSAASFTSFSADHLDWHGSLENYFQAKQNLFTHLSEGSQAVIAKQVEHRYPVYTPEGVQRVYVSSNSDADYALVGSDLVGPAGPYLKREDLRRALPHDISNFLSAAALAEAMGAEHDRIVEVMRQFSGIEHRQELVGTLKGVAFVNDSKATTPDSVRAAIEGRSHVVLIAGGRNKGLDYSSLAGYADRIDGVVAIGEAAPEVLAVFEGVVPTATADSMREAVAVAYGRFCPPGRYVILSPGATSFDWYRNYEERGLDFKNEVGRFLKEAHGG
jgi:UDP-N-acetylmuramoylalanine--D-glutamate ligase